jgi:urea transport system permease protein
MSFRIPALAVMTKCLPAFRVLVALLAAATALWTPAASAIDAPAVQKLATGDGDERSAAIAALLAEGDPRARDLMRALLDGELQSAGERILVVRGQTAADAVTGEPVSPLPAAREEVSVNNRLRRELGSALAAFDLLSRDAALRRAAVDALLTNADPSVSPLLAKALQDETHADIRSALALIKAGLDIKSSDPALKLAAVRTLSESDNPATKTLLLSLLQKDPDGNFVESDAALRAEASRSLRAVEYRLAWGERIGLAFAGVSLGSILLLAALGLAITYGLMGVINMAHGELIMIGAYTTYVVQNLFRAHAGGAFDWYPLAAIPAAFAVSAAVGMALERSVIRHLYGRPLETLLATWGISLALIQTVRSIFGAQNVQVENPAWLSGGVQVMSNVVLPWNRILIVAFAVAVLIGVWLLLTRSRLGLFVRGVTQNRAMASCMGVPTARVDTWAFGLGSGLAGLAGCALSQIGNVGPDLGQAYIVDSFMVVVLGGVGQLAGTVYAALGLGFVNKLLESWSGAVLAKIAVLVFIIVFIQKRPQGMFALKGRAVEA